MSSHPDEGFHDEISVGTEDSVESAPPFALVDGDHHHNNNGDGGMIVKSAEELPPPSCSGLMSPALSQETAPTALEGSSVIYSPKGFPSPINSAGAGVGSGSSGPGVAAVSSKDSIHQGIEFETAASLLAESPSLLLGQSSHFVGTRMGATTATITATDPIGADSLGFTQLMEGAGGAGIPAAGPPQETRPKPIQPLPSLPEDIGSKSSSNLLSAPSGLSTSVSPSSLGVSHPKSDFASSVPIRQPLSSFLQRGIETEQLDRDLFVVTMHLYDAGGDVQDVMDVVGNPDFLRLWCEPIRSIIITSSSEGARNATHRRQDPSHGDRTYDGEWIEATTPTLLNPSRSPSSSSVPSEGYYSYVNSIWRSVLGFPSYGKLTMFVERQRGRVGLTIGKFVDGRTAFHTIVVEKIVDDQTGSSMIRVTNKVRMGWDRDGVSSSSSRTLCCCCCGVDAMAIQRCCWSAKLDGHIAQTSASMSRLRLLIENGEGGVLRMTAEQPPEEQHSTAAIPAISSPLSSWSIGNMMAMTRSNRFDGQHEQVLSEPLLVSS